MGDTADVEIRRGLDGVVADETAVSKVMADTNSLTYRGYAVQDLCDNSNFEETAYLLLKGELRGTFAPSGLWNSPGAVM